MASRFQLHKERWSVCKRCRLHRSRIRTVLFKGQLPCDVLFIGEAPGASEDVIGRPFVGPAGKVLDRMIEQSIPDGIRYGVTNLIACIPRDEHGDKVVEPPDWAIRRCRARLQEVFEMARPDLYVLVGKHAAKYVELPTGAFYVEVIHPAAILRMDVSQQGLAFQRNVITITDAIEEMPR